MAQIRQAGFTVMPKTSQRCSECYVETVFYELELEMCPECYKRRQAGFPEREQLRIANLVKYGPMPI